MRNQNFRVYSILLTSVVALAACDDDDGEETTVGNSCTAADQCFVELDEEVIGDPVCLDRVPDGYCTHECTRDEDCCAVEGECAKDADQVCGPFESTGLKICFLSCEGQDDGDAYCALFAHESFICRSTGGGSENRKVCVPNG